MTCMGATISFKFQIMFLNFSSCSSKMDKNPVKLQARLVTHPQIMEVLLSPVYMHQRSQSVFWRTRSHLVPLRTLYFRVSYYITKFKSIHILKFSKKKKNPHILHGYDLSRARVFVSRWQCSGNAKRKVEQVQKCSDNMLNAINNIEKLQMRSARTFFKIKIKYFPTEIKYIKATI